MWLASTPAEWVRVSDPDERDRLIAEGGKEQIEYGSFSLIELPAQGRTQAASMDAVPGADGSHMRRIELHARLLDTQTRQVNLPGISARGVESGKRLFLVQFAGPVKTEWLGWLSAANLRRVDYVPNNAYIVYGSPKAWADFVSNHQTNTLIQFTGRYQPEYRIHPRTARLRAQTALLDTVDPDPVRLFSIQLVADKEANRATRALIDQLRDGEIRKDSSGRGYRRIIAPLPLSAIDALQLQPDVLIIRPYLEPRKYGERQGQIVAGNLQAGGAAPTGPGYLQWLYGLGFTQTQFTASGFIVNVTDSGIDEGSTSPNHFALYRDGNRFGTSRVRYNRLEGSPNSGSSLSGCDGHGTLNAHVVAGFSVQSGFPHEDTGGYQYGLGICPFVDVGSSVIFDPDSFTFPDYSDLISRAYSDGARISTDSWGADTFGDYDADAQEYDALVRDAQPSGSAVSAPGNQEMVIVFAAGNSGPSSGTVGSPGTAKNVLSVGASENVHSHSTANGGNDASGDDGCATPDSEADDANDIASFSSRGPCSDGRKKPDIVAPGTHVTGGIAQDSPAPDPTSSTGNDLACFDATGVCALPGGGSPGDADNFFPSGQQFYSTSSGTSHSTPAIAGAAALLRQYFINEALGLPSPAMTKAFLMNSTRYMTGTSANDTLWSGSQGMGSVDLGRAFDAVDRVLHDQRPSDVMTSTGQENVFSGTITDTSMPVRITLAWTDAPGSTTGNAYNNDLDLEVVVNGVVYKGNVFSGAFSVAGGSADFRNNVESVFLPAGTSGSILVRVRAANLNSDGIPNVSPSVDQDYALVAYNIVDTPVPIIEIEQTVLSGESCGGGNGVVDPDETVTLDLVLKNSGNLNTSNLVVELQADTEVTLPSGSQSYGALTAGGSAVSRPFSFTASATCGQAIEATFLVSDGGSNLPSFSVNLPVGILVGSTVTNTQSGIISIPVSGSEGPASSYPSTLQVSGLSGDILDMNVRLSGLSHTWPSDLDILLVSPVGDAVVLMSAQGGGDDISGVDLTFDDEASGTLPSSGITSGTYRPPESFPEAVFDAPAPGSGYSSGLDTFDESTANGTWSLYIMDNADLDSGALVDGWELILETGEPFCCGSNQPPALASIPSRTITVSNSLSFNVSATEVDGDAVSLIASNLPPGAAFGTTNLNGQFSWASAEPVGVYTSSITAVDKDGFDTEFFTITVEPEVVSGNCGVILSEYVEGSGNNKAIELYNGSDSSVDLSSYEVRMYFNGSIFPGTTVSLTGTLAADGTHVLGDDDAGSSLSTRIDQISSASFFNGDDVVELYEGTNLVDSIGQIGGSTDFAKDVTLVRKPEVTEGDADSSDAFTLTEWTSYPIDTFTNAGSHVMNCTGGGGGGTPPVLLSIGDQSVAVGGTLNLQVSAAITDGDPVTLSASNLPPGAVFSSTNNQGTLTWTAPGSPVSYQTTFTASDADGSVSETITLSVVEVIQGDLWINEIHYDNQSADTGEGVEIAGPAGVDLSAYTLTPYNGSIGQSYDPVALSGTIPDEGCGFGAVWVPVQGLQNGSPDGVALSDASGVIEFISYEGTFTALNGPAAGLESVSIGVAQQPPGSSDATLQLSGSGTNRSVFAWIQGTQSTRGSLNVLQSISPCGGNPDTDADGIPDAWEEDNFGSLTNATAISDSDLDGFLDIEEFVGATDPNAPTNFPRIFLQPMWTNAPSVSFPSSTGRVYVLEGRTNLILGQWQELNRLSGDGTTQFLPQTNCQPIEVFRLNIQLP